MSRSTWDTSRRTGISLTGLSPSMAGISWPFCYPYVESYQGPATPFRKRNGLGCSVFARHYLRNHCCFLFLRVLRCFTSPGIAPKSYVFRLRYPAITRDGFPHSDISGSKCACHSPKLFAAYHVLHRLLVPRHPSCALICLKKIFSSSRQKLLTLKPMQLSKNSHPEG